MNPEVRNVADDKKVKLKLVDLVGIGNLLEHLVVEGVISCEEQDKIIKRIAKGNDFAEHTLSVLAGYQRSEKEVLERTSRKNMDMPQQYKPDESYVSLTDIVRTHSDDAPGYVIQSWLRSGNTLAFLNLWEKENNPDYRSSCDLDRSWYFLLTSSMLI